MTNMGNAGRREEFRPIILSTKMTKINTGNERLMGKVPSAFGKMFTLNREQLLLSSISVIGSIL